MALSNLFSPLQLRMAEGEDNSIALPFTPRPLALNGELVGDVGFDPLGFSEEVGGGRNISFFVPKCSSKAVESLELTEPSCDCEVLVACLPS